MVVSRAAGPAESVSFLHETDSEVPPEEVDFDLLSTKVAELVEVVEPELKGCSIYLVGMMGSGKTTLGKMLANTLKYRSPWRREDA